MSPYHYALQDACYPSLSPRDCKLPEGRDTIMCPKASLACGTAPDRWLVTKHNCISHTHTPHRQLPHISRTQTEPRRHCTNTHKICHIRSCPCKLNHCDLFPRLSHCHIPHTLSPPAADHTLNYRDSSNPQSRVHTVFYTSMVTICTQTRILSPAS